MGTAPPGRRLRAGWGRGAVVANLDPHGARETVVHLDVAAFGKQPGEVFTVRDLVTGAEWQWGSDAYVRLDPFAEPVHILAVEH